MGQNDLPPGFIFDPKDEELIENFLQPLCNGDQWPLNIIPFIDLYQHPNNLKTILDEKRCSLGYFKYFRPNESYFFSELKKKSDSDKRIIRSIKCGHWKRTSLCGGKKKVFTFYEGDDKDKKTKTDWIMHEYTLDGEQTHEKMIVLCKLYNSRRSCEDSDDDDDLFVSESSNVDDTNTVSIEFSDANLSFAPYQAEHCNVANAVRSPFSAQFGQVVPSNAPQAMEGNVYLTAMNEEYPQLVQDPFPAHAALPSTPGNSSSSSILQSSHFIDCQVTDTSEVDYCYWMNENLGQQVSEAYVYDEDPLQTFQEQLNEEDNQWLTSQ